MLVQVSLTALGKSYGFGSFDLRPDWAALVLPVLVAVGAGLLGSAVLETPIGSSSIGFI